MKLYFMIGVDILIFNLRAEDVSRVLDLLNLAKMIGRVLEWEAKTRAGTRLLVPANRETRCFGKKDKKSRVYRQR
jgi:hypothetical protein